MRILLLLALSWHLLVRQMAKKQNIKIVREQIYWSYANLAMAHTAVDKKQENKLIDKNIEDLKDLELPFKIELLPVSYPLSNNLTLNADSLK